MKTGLFRPRKSKSETLVYIGMLALSFLAYWAAVDIGLIQDYGVVYNAILSVTISLFAGLLARLVVRNLSNNQGGEPHG